MSRKNSAPPPSDSDVCRRLVEVRVAFAGERGQSRFAQLLGLTPSTYGNYEKTRVPPIGLLVRVAELTGRDLRWLATGRSPEQEAGPAWAGNPQHWAMLQRVARLLDERPANLAALAAFLDLLEEKALLERSREIVLDKTAPPRVLPQGRDGRADNDASEDRNTPAGSFRGLPDFGRWVPIFGRAAAGLARFWAELDGRLADLPAASALDELIGKAASLSDADSKLAVFESASPGTEGSASIAAGSGAATGRSKASRRRPASPLRVRLIQLSEPLTDYQLTEFLESPELADRYRPLFGLRLDGDSMAPMFADGTIVLCSPSEPARPGLPAIVRLAGQIGLTCKIYRPREAMVRLVPANDKYEPQEFPARQLEWALAVLGKVRVG